MSTEQVIALIAAVGGGAVFREVVGGLWKWVTGRQKAERDAIQALEAERRYRVQVEEQMYWLRASLIRLGRPDLVPPLPQRGEPAPAGWWNPSGSLIEPPHTGPSKES